MQEKEKGFFTLLKGQWCGSQPKMITSTRDLLRSLRDGREDLRIQRKSTENICGGLHANSQNNRLLFLGQVEQKEFSYLRHAETKKENLSIPRAYRCLKYLPPFTFQC